MARDLRVLVRVIEQLTNDFDFLRDLSQGIDICEDLKRDEA